MLQALQRIHHVAIPEVEALQLEERTPISSGPLSLDSKLMFQKGRRETLCRCMAHLSQATIALRRHCLAVPGNNLFRGILV